MQAFFLPVAILTRIIVNALAYVFQKKLTRSAHPMFVNLATYASLALISLFIVPWGRLHNLSHWFWIYSIIGGMAGALGNGLIIKALETGDLSVLGPINAYKSIVGMVFAFVIVHELPNTWGLMGMILIIAGSYVVLKQKGEPFNWQMLSQPAIRYRLLALVLTGIQAVIDKKIILLSDLQLAFCSWCMFGFLFSLILCKGHQLSISKQLKGLRQSDIGLYLAMVICIGLMTLSTNYVFAHMPVAEALALFQLSLVLTVYFGHSFFQEKSLLRKLMGTPVMIAGSLLIILMK